MLRTWTARALGCVLVFGVGCAETNKSLGNLGQNNETDGGSGGSASGAGGEPEAGAGGEASAGGGATGSGGAPAAGGTHATAGSGGAFIGGSGGAPKGGSGGAPKGGAGGVATGGSGGELSECVIDCEPGNRKKLTWGGDGGLVAYHDSSEISPCSTRYYHYRTPGFASVPAASCYSFMPVCYPDLSPVTFADVYEALDAPGVKAAFAQSGTVYGIDSRPYDGIVFVAHYGDAVIYVGDPCNGMAACTEIPSDVAAFQKVLQDLDAQELARGDCLATFPR